MQNATFPGATLQFADAPQLRLTYTPAAVVTDGIWTDFQTTALGDLFINPSSDNSGAPEDRFVGINAANPGNTLEINANWPALSPQRAGLRFTDLTNAVNPVTNPDPERGVLSVDVQGDVIFVRDEGGGSIRFFSASTRWNSGWRHAARCECRLLQEKSRG